MAFVPFVESDQPTMAAFNEKFQQNYDAVIAAAGRVETGSYAGANDSTKSLTFGFVPKIVFINGNNEDQASFANYSLLVVPCQGLTASITSYGFLATSTYGLAPSSNYYASLSDKTLTLQSGSYENFNKIGRTYRYVAIA